MRAITRIGFGALTVAAALSCILAAQPAQAQAPICRSTALVPTELLNAISLRVPYNPSPGPEICDKMAAAEVKGCYKQVQISAECENARNDLNAKADEGICQTISDASAQAACLDNVKAVLDALTQGVTDATASGLQSCTDLGPTVTSRCIAGTL